MVRIRVTRVVFRVKEPSNQVRSTKLRVSPMIMRRGCPLLRAPAQRRLMAGRGRASEGCEGGKPLTWHLSLRRVGLPRVGINRAATKLVYVVQNRRDDKPHPRKDGEDETWGCEARMKQPVSDADCRIGEGCIMRQAQG